MRVDLSKICMYNLGSKNCDILNYLYSQYRHTLKKSIHKFTTLKVRKISETRGNPKSSFYYLMDIFFFEEKIYVDKKKV